MNKRMTVRDIAGFCPEEAIWRMLDHVSGFLIKESSGFPLNADTIVVDGEQFMVTGSPDDTTMEDMVWALGATAYYAATGHKVFGGHGRSYQQEHPQVSLPVLPKTFQTLTPVIHRCLCYDTSERISMEELKHLAQEGLDTCSQRQRNKAIQTGNPVKERKNLFDKWPEEMKES